MANMMTSRGDRTETHPLMAHAHGMRRGWFAPSTLRPVGKGIPMRIPKGTRTPKTAVIFVGRENAATISEKVGRVRL